GTPVLAREAGHSVRRILHASGDATGAEVSRALGGAARRSPVRVVEHAWVAEILVSEG
ncbi:MAG: L-aspartate oxidase, partial [Actinobacteria bacterium]|nr:L-aspartate oxidase [Actinomycetota bacterium]NIS28727.1 L-aspartate oxidase [Actinomycetota bacterium]NIT94115.1 L-aspartate oxidase [Actinomycetota bacterium]NIU17743.1 L-aspartate oxidase [Actinomycetota bacterium]NIU64189.1 L-aspartate oxidase [Actinomycetota bacterium]